MREWMRRPLLSRCSKLAKRRKGTRARAGRGGDGLDSPVVLLSQFQDRREPLYELGREPGQPLARFGNHSFKIGARQRGQRFLGKKVSLEVLQRGFAQFGTSTYRCVKRIEAAQGP